MANKRTFTLLFAAVIISIGFSTAPAFAATPGTWKGTAEFGLFELVVTADGTGIETAKYNLSEWECGGLTQSGERKVSWRTPMPIIDSAFSDTEVYTFTEAIKLELTISGSFDTDTQAAGTWNAALSGEECAAGTWEASLQDATP